MHGGLAPAGLLDGATGTPTFRDPVFFDRPIAARLRRLGGTLERQLGMERDELIVGLTADLLARHGHVRAARPIDSTPAVRLMRHYLDDQPERNVRLGELSTLTGLSVFHLTRVFRRQVGMAPHAYHLAGRVMRGKDELRRGASVTQVAHRLGFADQSHFTRHFRRIVGISPAAYAQHSRRTT